MNRTGPGPQPLRNVNNVSNVFQNQQNPNARQPTLGSSRLQNGKLSGGPGWGYGGIGAATTNPPQGGQARPAGLSFASTIGGGHSQTPLDMSDFPTLSGNSQSQQANSSQNVWGGTLGRTNTNPPVQRPPGQNSQNQVAPGPPPQQLGADSENLRPSPFSSGVLDDYRYDDREGATRDPRRTGQQGGADDFPPLNGLGGRPNPQAGTGQTSQLQGLGEGSGYLQSQQRNGGFTSESQQEGLTPGSAGGRVVSPSDVPSGASRSPLDGQQDLNGGPRHPLDLNSRLAQDPTSFTIAQRGTRPVGDNYSSRYPSGEQPPQDPQPNGTPTDSAQTNGDTNMPAIDRFGLPGLLHEIKSLTPDQHTIRFGFDITTFTNLDLTRPGPIYPDWAGPFADSNTRPVVPDFKLPPAYTVNNVPPLEEKLPSFSDETLFTIFYSMPKDRAQELAANELYSRDWRWHKRMGQWMMKAKEFGEPVQLPSQKEERGWYYFFDLQNWKRERKEFILNYEHLYHPSERLGIAGTM